MGVLPQPSRTLGAPGIYAALDALPPPRLDGLPMDVAAFVGVAPRGPSRLPALPETWRFDRPTVGLPRQRSTAVAVDSFDRYRQLYGGFEGPGRLPFAVASFFEQGGRRAYVVRVVHDYGDPGLDAAGTARGSLRRVDVAGAAGPAGLVARDEGTWGNQLRADLGFTVTPQPFRAADTTTLTLDGDHPLEPGTLLRLTLADGTVVARFVARIVHRGREQAAADVAVATFDGPPLGAPPARVEVVEGVLAVDDGGRTERHRGLGLSARHPRWLATVLSNESELVFPAAAWAAADLVPQDLDDLPRAPALADAARFSDGADRYADLVAGDFFGAGFDPADPRPDDGIHAVVGIDEVASLVVPDLYVPEPLPPIERVVEEPSLAGPEFAPCIELAPPAEEAESAPVELPGLHLDPALELDVIVALQLRLVAEAERQCRFVVLLDVPPGLTPRRLDAWRARFSSAYAAAYHPWLRIDRADDQRDALVLLNPSAAAAGIVAAQERRFGIAHGPANVLAQGVVDVDERLPAARHDRLHPAGVNVFLHERDGVRLTAARTLARDPSVRQLSVRRLMIMLRRVLVEQTQWMVFEPNDESLRADVRSMLRAYLGQLYQQGMLRGDREDDAFRVRCDAELNPTPVVDAGRLIAEIQVAPAEPLEFIRLQLVRTGDGTVVREV